MKLRIETEFENGSNRYIAEIPTMPGVMAYGPTREDAIKAVQALALRVLADGILSDVIADAFVDQIFEVAP